MARAERREGLRPKHIGIVACSSPGAALCYRIICTEGEKFLGKRYAHPEVSLHGYSFSDYMEYIERGDWNKVADLMVSSARKLAAVGADFAITPDNTIHVVFDEVVRRSPIPWLHIAEEVAKEAVRRGFKRLGVLGTKYLMESDVYPSKLRKYCLEYVIPGEEERVRINEVIFNELVYGVVKSASRAYLVKVIEGLKREGCDAVVLGCTELPLIISDEVSPLPTLNSTRILALAALREAVGQRS